MIINKIIDLRNFLERKIIRKWHVACLSDQVVIYIGSYENCEEVIDYLAGDIYAILKRKQLSALMKETLKHF